MTLYGSVDEYYIGRCLELARQGEGRTHPNPMVGAVVLDAKGRKAGEGYHARAGQPHAETIALKQAGDRARGGTLYVNLEPCNHTGRTPPCTRAIIEAGIERVICGTLDPNPMVAGSGRDELQNNRISVRYGFLEEKCRVLNEAFFHFITNGKPFVTLKLAMTMDGKIATRSGESQWLTGEFSRQYVHHLRRKHDAILTTVETVIADNPKLTVRGIPLSPGEQPPVRVVIDRQFRMNPDEYHIFEADDVETWVFTSKLGHDRAHAERASELGARVIEVEETGVGLDLKAVLTYLGGEEITALLIEAGGRMAGHLMNQGLVNKLQLFYGPCVLPDPSARPAFSEGVVLQLAGAPKLTVKRTTMLEHDVVVEAYPQIKSKAISVIRPTLPPVAGPIG